MKKYLFIFVLPMALMACGGDGSSSDGENSGESTEVMASDADLQTIEASKSVENDAEKANQKADSILNAL